MKCKTLINTRLLLLFAFLLSGFFSFSISSESYALDNYSITYSSSNPYPSSGGSYVCSDSTSGIPNCTGYSYIKIDLQGLPSDFSDSTLYMSFGNSSNRTYYISMKNGSIYFPMTDYYIAGGFYLNPRTLFTNSDLSLTITLLVDSPFNCPEPPSGSLDITSNGTYDVTNYASAVVNVPESSGGDGGSTDVSGIVNALYVVAAVPLVIYFFYCIYRMIIKTTGAF